eukprot:7380899-Prymnesium_polylepis.2
MRAQSDARGARVALQHHRAQILGEQREADLPMALPAHQPGHQRTKEAAVDQVLGRRVKEGVKLAALAQLVLFVDHRYRHPRPGVPHLVRKMVALSAHERLAVEVHEKVRRLQLALGAHARRDPRRAAHLRLLRAAHSARALQHLALQRAAGAHQPSRRSLQRGDDNIRRRGGRIGRSLIDERLARHADHSKMLPQLGYGLHGARVVVRRVEHHARWEPELLLEQAVRNKQRQTTVVGVARAEAQHALGDLDQRDHLQVRDAVPDDAPAAVEEVPAHRVVLNLRLKRFDRRAALGEIRLVHKNVWLPLLERRDHLANAVARGKVPLG